MTAREIEKFLKAHLLPDLPDWAARGAGMFVRPVGCVVRSVGFHGSKNDRKDDAVRSLYVAAAVRPLYLPPEDGAGGVIFGDRIAAERWVRGAEEKLARRLRKLIDGPARRIIETYATPELIVANADARKGGPYVRQAVACSLIWLRRYDDALAALDAARAELREYVQSPYHGEWGEAMLGRIERLRAVLLKDPAAARAQLERWAEQSAAKQGLTPYL